MPDEMNIASIVGTTAVIVSVMVLSRSSAVSNTPFCTFQTARDTHSVLQIENAVAASLLTVFENILNEEESMTIPRSAARVPKAGPAACLSASAAIVTKYFASYPLISFLSI